MAENVEFADEPLWTPPAERAAATAMEQFRRFAVERSGRGMADSVELHRWSVDEPEAFWSTLAAHLLPSVDIGRVSWSPRTGWAPPGGFPTPA